MVRCNGFVLDLSRYIVISFELHGFSFWHEVNRRKLLLNGDNLNNQMRIRVSDRSHNETICAQYNRFNFIFFLYINLLYTSTLMQAPTHALLLVYLFDTCSVLSVSGARGFKVSILKLRNVFIYLLLLSLRLKHLIKVVVRCPDFFAVFKCVFLPSLHVTRFWRTRIK